VTLSRETGSVRRTSVPSPGALRISALPPCRRIRPTIDPRKRASVTPTTVIACEFPARQLIELIETGDPYTAELGRLHNVEYIDLPTGQRSGLVEIRDILQGIEGIEFADMGARDVVRHKIVQDIVEAYRVHDDARARGDG